MLESESSSELSVVDERDQLLWRRRRSWRRFWWYLEDWLRDGLWDLDSALGYWMDMFPMAIKASGKLSVLIKSPGVLTGIPLYPS